MLKQFLVVHGQNVWLGVAVNRLMWLTFGGVVLCFFYVLLIRLGVSVGIVAFVLSVCSFKCCKQCWDFQVF